jgi:hypothetical protein
VVYYLTEMPPGERTRGVTLEEVYAGNIALNLTIPRAAIVSTAMRGVLGLQREGYAAEEADSCKECHQGGTSRKGSFLLIDSSRDPLAFIEHALLV